MSEDYTERMTSKQTGDLGETIACTFLRRKGHSIMERNYRKAWGEIDIIAERAGVVHFIEVKSVTRIGLPDVSRENNDYRPEEQVHPKKLEKISRTAETYMAEREDGREYQIDVVAIFLDPARRQARCRLYENVS